jgi:hypothetical protein
MKKKKSFHPAQGKDMTNHHDGSVIKNMLDQVALWKKAQSQLSKIESLTK